MGFTEWISESRQRFQNDTPRNAAIESAYWFYIGALGRLDDRISYGEPIYNSDWDLLIILDACRPDALKQAASDHEYINPSFQTINSVGSTSYQWMERNFRSEYSDEMAQTIHITANPHSADHLNESDFLKLYPVWKSAWDADIGVTRAEDVTEAAIWQGRNTDHERMIVHYMQPHFPAVPVDDSRFHVNESEDGVEPNLSIWKDLRTGEITKEEVWDAYIQNLDYVLEEVEVLLNNIDAEVAIITADHSEAFSEYGIYAHIKAPLRLMREVPWVETTATDEETLDPSLSPDGVEKDVQERLSDLGYMT